MNSHHGHRSEILTGTPAASFTAGLALLLMLALLAVLSAALLSISDPRARQGGGTPAGRLALVTAMRGLWTDEADWTRLVLTANASDASDASEIDATAQRLARDPIEVGDAVKPFYGDRAGQELAVLLRGHLRGAAEVLSAVRANDAAGLEAARRAWYANAGEIAAFLSDADPRRFPRAEVEPMLRVPMDLVLHAASDQRQGRHSESLTDFDRARREGLRVAEMLSVGILDPVPADL